MFIQIEVSNVKYKSIVRIAPKDPISSRANVVGAVELTSQRELTCVSTTSFNNNGMSSVATKVVSEKIHFTP